MKRLNIFLTTLVIAAFVLTACGPQETQAPATEAPTEAPATEAPATEMPATEAPATEAPATAEATITPTLGPPAGDVSFFSTQFNNVDEGAKFRAILQEGGNYDFSGSEEGPLLDLVLAGADGCHDEHDRCSG